MVSLGLTFLSPIAGIVAAAIALPTLLALYFLKLRRRPVRVSSTLLWWRAAQDLQVNAPFRMVRPSWLLALQMLALALVCAAIGRPAIDSASASGDRVIIVIDRSASMSATDGGPGGRTRLEQAQREAVELVDRLPSSARVMVVGFASEARVEASFTGAKGAARSAIRALGPTDQPAAPEGALRIARAFVAGGENAAQAPPLIVFISDGAIDRSPDDPVSLGDAPVEFIRVGPAPEEPRDNLGVVALSARRDLEDPGLIRLFARVRSTLDREIATAAVASLGGEEIGRLPLAIPAGGEQTLATEIRHSGGGTLTLTIARDDRLASDNTAGLALAPPRELRIALVRPRAGAGAFWERAVEDALATLELGEVETFTPSTFALAGDASGFDLVVFDRARPESLPRSPSLSFGAGVPVPGLLVGEGPDQTVNVDFWNRAHPAMRSVSLDTLRISSPARIEQPGPGSRVEGASVRSTVLARTRVGPLILLLEHGVWRRVVVGLTMEDTNWLRDISFPTFIANAVEYLTAAGAGGLGQAVRAGEPLSLPAPGAVGSAEIIAPTGDRLRAPVGPDGLARLGRVERAGIYLVAGGDPDRAAAVVSVLDTTETSIETRDRIDVTGELVDASTVAATAPREIWTWLLLAAFTLMMAEWVVYAWRMRI